MDSRRRLAAVLYRTGGFTATARFADADVTKLDGMHPHLALADLIHSHEHRVIPH